MVDLAWDHLTTGSDPKGLDGPYPLRPLETGFLRLVFNGHSEVKREAFRWGVHPHWQKVRDSYKRTLAGARERALRGEFKNPLPDAAGKRHEIDREFHLGIAQAAMEVLAGSGLSDFEDIRPNGWGKDEKPKPHGTTVSDNFNRSNQNALGSSSEGWTWTEAVAGYWDIVSNQAAVDASGVIVYGRCGKSLSTLVHYSQVDYASFTNSGTLSNILASVARIAASMVNDHARFQVDGYNEAGTTRKVVSGVTTTIAGPTGVTVTGLPKAIYLSVDASDSYVSKWNGVKVHSGTDTGIPDGYDVGMLAYKGTGTTVVADNFIAADIAASGHPTIKRFGGVPFAALNRGVW